MKTDSDATLPDEKPKAELAKEVITSKRKYFFPTSGEVEAESLDAAIAQVETQSDDEKKKGKVING